MDAFNSINYISILYTIYLYIANRDCAFACGES